MSTADEVVEAAVDPRAGLQVVHIRTDRARTRVLAAGTRAAVAEAVRPYAG